MASRWSTAFVEPPVAATPAIPFSNEVRVSTSRADRPAASISITSRPAASPTAGFAGSRAATLAEPIGESPMNSITSAMVLAVYWPPQAPAPGQATSSSSRRSASVIFPASRAPMASKTSLTSTSRPRKRPWAIEPP